MKEMEEKKELLLLEKDKMVSETAGEADAGDALDAYMSGLSSQLGILFMFMKNLCWYDKHFSFAFLCLSNTPQF